MDATRKDACVNSPPNVRRYFNTKESITPIKLSGGGWLTPSLSLPSPWYNPQR